MKKSKIKYRQQWQRWHQSYEKRAATEFRKLFRYWASNLELTGGQAMWASQMDRQFKLEDIVKTYTNVYMGIGLVHGPRVGRDINLEHTKSFEKEVFKDFYARYVALYLQSKAMGRILQIRRIFTQFIGELLLDQRARMIEVFGKEPTISELVDWMHKQAGSRKFYRWQIMRIARTESTAAANYAGIRATNQSGFATVKEWMSYQDARTRRAPDDSFDHWHMNGKSVPTNEKFVMQGKYRTDVLDYPGDPQGHPGNIINCRCTLIYKPMKDADGNLVRL